MSAVLNLLHPVSTSSTIARHLLQFTVQGKITETDAPTIRVDATPSGLLVSPPPSPPPFYAECPLSHDKFMGQALNNAGLHTRWLGYDEMGVCVCVVMMK